MRRKKLEKIECEICGEKDKSTLQKHHIIPRTEIDTSNKDENIAVICSNCHNKHHLGSIEILGVLPSTKLPYGRTLIYRENGVVNIPDAEQYIIRNKPRSMKVYIKEEDEIN